MGEVPLVVFSGGGTGGHLYPALALRDALQDRLTIRSQFVGAQRGLEARILSERAIEVLLLDVEGLSRSAWHRNPGIVLRLFRAVRRTIRAYREWRPNLVVVTGGYASAPAGLAAAALKIPLALQEQNSWPGVTTRLLARWASQIHLAFPEATERLPVKARSLAVHSGNPVRLLPPLDPPAARLALGLPEEARTVLITGGSQGSRAINQRVLDAIAHQRDARPDVQLLWATGPSHHTSVQAELVRLGTPGWVYAVPYLDDMPTALRAADIAVGRAGAMTTSEFLCAGLPSVLIPLPTAAANHQSHNAEALARAGVALALEEATATGATLWGALTQLLGDDPLRAQMSERALARSRPDAAPQIAAQLSTLLEGSP